MLGIWTSSRSFPHGILPTVPTCRVCSGIILLQQKAYIESKHSGTDWHLISQEHSGHCSAGQFYGTMEPSLVLDSLQVRHSGWRLWLTTFQPQHSFFQCRGRMVDKCNPSHLFMVFGYLPLVIIYLKFDVKSLFSTVWRNGVCFYSWFSEHVLYRQP